MLCIVRTFHQVRNIHCHMTTESRNNAARRNYPLLGNGSVNICLRAAADTQATKRRNFWNGVLYAVQLGVRSEDEGGICGVCGSVKLKRVTAVTR
jgi:hypothetical protein